MTGAIQDMGPSDLLAHYHASLIESRRLGEEVRQKTREHAEPLLILSLLKTQVPLSETKIVELSALGKTLTHVILGTLR